jgi:hypothetical protein
MEAWANVMKYTKSALKELIREVAKEHSLDLGPEDAPSFLNEDHGLGDADEDEIRDWDEFIERDMLALHATLENAKEALGTLSPEREEIFDLLVDLVDSEDDDEEEDWDEEEEEEKYEPKHFTDLGRSGGFTLPPGYTED